MAGKGKAVGQMTHQVRQWNFTSGKSYRNPFAEADVDVVVTGPGGATWRVPAFWAGGKKWSFRFAAPKAGAYSFRTECSDASNAGLHGKEGEFKVAAYKGDNPPLQGPVGQARPFPVRRPGARRGVQGQADRPRHRAGMAHRQVHRRRARPLDYPVCTLYWRCRGSGVENSEMTNDQ